MRCIAHDATEVRAAVGIEQDGELLLGLFGRPG